MSYSVNLKGAISGVNTAAGETVLELDVAPLLEGTDYAVGTDLSVQANLDAAVAMPSVTYVAYYAGNAAQPIENFQTAGGYNDDWNNITGGRPTGTFTMAVRVKEKHSDNSVVVGPWCKGNRFTVSAATTTTTTTTTAAPTTTTAAPSDNDFAAYTNSNGTMITEDSTVFTVGAKSIKIASDGTGPGLYRSVTMPSSGIVTFTRWFRTASLLTVTSAEVMVASLMNTAQDAWLLASGYHHQSNDTTKTGIGLISAGSWVPAVLETAMVINTWYKLVLEVNCGTNQHRLTVYSSNGSTPLGQTAWLATPAPISGVQGILKIGQTGATNTSWIDGLIDPI